MDTGISWLATKTTRFVVVASMLYCDVQLCCHGWTMTGPSSPWPQSTTARLAEAEWSSTTDDDDDDDASDNHHHGRCPTLLLSNPPSSSSTRQHFLHRLVTDVETSAAVLLASTLCHPKAAKAMTTKHQRPTMTAATATLFDASVVLDSSSTAVCQNGGLVAESAVPGAYSSICMSLTERLVPLPRYQHRLKKKQMKQMKQQTISNRDKNDDDEIWDDDGILVIRQQPAGSGQTGMTVWNSGLLMTRLLDALVDDDLVQRSIPSTTTKIKWNEQDVLELGCGTGLVSIAASKLGARSVLATDGNPQVLQLAQDNIQRNNDGSDSRRRQLLRDDDPSTTTTTTNIRTQPLQWGLLDAMDYSECATLVLGADLTYNAGSWRALAETMATVLKPNGYVVYLSLGHEGFNVQAEVDGFLSVATSTAVGLERVPDLEGIDVSKLLLQDVLDNDAELKLIAQGGGARVVILHKKRSTLA